MARTKNSDDNRNGQGQWADGNAGGPGNPRARFAPHLRNALNECITIEMVQNVVNHIYMRALSGDMPAARLFLQYAVGKPARIDSMEESQHDSPPETESMPAESAASETVTIEQTVGDGEPECVSPRCNARGEQTVREQTVGDGEPVGVSPRCDAVRGEQTVRTATKQVVPEVKAEQANGNGAVGASSGVSQTPSLAPRVV